MTYLPSDFLYNNVRTNKFVKGIPHMEELVGINWKCLMNNERAADVSGYVPGPRLQSSEILAVNMNMTSNENELLDIKV